MREMTDQEKEAMASRIRSHRIELEARGIDPDAGMGIGGVVGVGIGLMGWLATLFAVVLIICGLIGRFS